MLLELFKRLSSTVYLRLPKPLTREEQSLMCTLWLTKIYFGRENLISLTHWFKWKSLSTFWTSRNSCSPIFKWKCSAMRVDESSTLTQIWCYWSHPVYVCFSRPRTDLKKTRMRAKLEIFQEALQRREETQISRALHTECDRILYIQEVLNDNTMQFLYSFSTLEFWVAKYSEIHDKLNLVYILLASTKTTAANGPRLHFALKELRAH